MIGDELATGRTLGSYQLLVPLAHGATADVWAARTTGSHLEKIVAMKLMRAEEAEDVDAESMFLDEARLVARIRHPNVAAVLDLGEEDDTLFIVVEWVEGEPLQVLMREAWGGGGRTSGPRRGVPLALAARIVRQAASGLHAAHELCDDAGTPLQIVHRDVSPQNILVGYDGSVKVIDFGVAKAASNMQRTRVGQIKGKVPYMAPEQAVGDDVDRRSDVFALGIVLYQLVTGRHPFRTDSEYATLARIRDKNPAESARTHAPDVPAAVDEVMLRAIAKNREDRFATMAELSRALERALPTSPDTDRELGAFVASLLSKRAERRGQAIREALAAVRGAAPGRPLRTTQRLLFDEPAESIPRGGPSRSIAPPAPTAPPSSTRAPESSPRASTAPVSGASDEETPDFRPRSRRLLLIATGTVLLLALAAGIAIGMR